MKNTAKDLAFFVRTSWRYLGCDRGRGRWAARRQYLRGLVPAGLRFLRAQRQDRAEVSGV